MSAQPQKASWFGLPNPQKLTPEERRDIEHLQGRCALVRIIVRYLRGDVILEGRYGDGVAVRTQSAYLHVAIRKFRESYDTAAQYGMIR